MERPYPITILMLEDNPEYKASFELMASKDRILVKSVDNAEDLIIILKENPRKYKFIVLDARAFFTEGEKKGAETEINLIYLFREIKNVEKEYGVILPYAINTGFADIKISHEKKVDCPIFSKNSESELIQYIWDEQNKTKEAYVKKEFPEIVPLFDAFLTDKVQEKVISLYFHHNYNNASLGDRLTSLSSLRMINEQILDVLFKELHGRTWKDITDKIGSRSRVIAEHLESYHDISSSMRDECINIYKTASKYGEHGEEDIKDDREFPSHRMIAAHAMGILELFKKANKLLEL